MNKLLSLILTVVLLFTLSACGNNGEKYDSAADNTEALPVADSVETENTADNGQIPEAAAYGRRVAAVPETSAQIRETPERALITHDEAVVIALDHFGLTAEDVYELDAEIEKEYGVTFWEVEFETAEFEYTVLIEAEDGIVIREYKEIND